MQKASVGGFDVVFEAVGGGDTLQTAIEAVRPAEKL